MSQDPSSAEAPPPPRLGRYRLIRCISTGGMARVYEARRDGLAGVSTKVAIKVILPEHATDEKFQQLFVNEARIGSQLQHQNLVQIQDFDREGEHYYLVMEYVEGLTLRRIITLCKRAGVHVPLAVIAEIGRHVCEGLHYAHTARRDDGEPLKLVHRDIKPSNLIINPQGVTKILDFGISKALSSLESKGAVKGTWGYMSPEQAEGREVSAGADQYGVAAVLYELAMTRPLFPEKEPRELRQLMAQDEGARRASRLGGTYAPLHYPLVRALQREPSARWVNCLVMAQELARLVPDQVIARQQLMTFITHIRALDEARKANSPELVAAATQRLIAAGYAAEVHADAHDDASSGVSEISQPRSDGSPGADPASPYGSHTIPPPDGVPGPAAIPLPRSLAAISPAEQSPYLSGMPVTVGDAWRPHGHEQVRPIAPDPERSGPSIGAVLMVGFALVVFAFVGYRVLAVPGASAPLPADPTQAPIQAGVPVTPPVELPPTQGTPSDPGTPNPGTTNAGTTNAGAVDPGSADAGTTNAGTGGSASPRPNPRPRRDPDPVPEPLPPPVEAAPGTLHASGRVPGTITIVGYGSNHSEAPIKIHYQASGRQRVEFRPDGEGETSFLPVDVGPGERVCVVCGAEANSCSKVECGG